LLPARPSDDAASPSPSVPLSPKDYPDYSRGLDAKVPVGQPARDFALQEVGGGQIVRLSDFRGRKPVVLIFGSTRGIFPRKQAGPLEELYRTYRGWAAFLFVHLRETGPDPATGRPDDPRERVREALASFPLTMPCVLENARGETQSFYRAWPQRLVVVGIDGRYVLDAGRGLPNGWDLAKVEACLKAQKP
jgi:hypothetical protein